MAIYIIICNIHFLEKQKNELHFKKLTKDISEKKDFQSLISDLEYQLSIRESIFIKEFHGPEKGFKRAVAK